ncbi:hypothetical protein TsocGM_05650 [Tautonia sociabilis]|uniref:Uncharacterized protein n=2 Tax=Tautonia sociabilis TaxID=2080755 RepID=A0A432MP39_9BACT|nr:hypothetical protein TsocGM_05650 [Tautonia sociabilis]
MGGMGGGFRSVPPTGLPTAALQPGQTRNLRTRAVSLAPPVGGRAVLPSEGEPLRLADIAQTDAGRDPLVQKALRQLALEKAPEAVSQLVLWHLIYDLDWTSLSELSRSWANGFEVTLARQFVERLERTGEEAPLAAPGRISIEMDGSDPIAEPLCQVLGGSRMFGMEVGLDAPASPEESSLACLIRFHKAPAEGSDREATVLVYASDAEARSWAPMGKFSLAIPTDAPAEQLADNLAGGILGRLVRGQVTKGKKVDGHQTYKLRVDNASPLLLNGLAVAGAAAEPDISPSMIAGFSLAPRHSMTFTVSEEAVERLHLDSGVTIVAADLHAL